MSQLTLRMLSIDDRMVTTELDRAGYRRMGVTIRSATSYQEAQNILKGNPIDVIVINMDYEKINALQICRHFKGQEETKKIPVVITSVQDKASVMKLSAEAGADLFVEQPMPRQYFIEKLRGLLDQKTRETNRVNYEGKARFQLDGKDCECAIGDLSKSGILLSLDSQDVKIGTTLEMEFEIPGYKKPIQVTGEVVRKITDRVNNKLTQIGYGVRFDVFHGDSQKRLEKYVMKTQNDDPKLTYYL